MAPGLLITTVAAHFISNPRGEPTVVSGGRPAAFYTPFLVASFVTLLNKCFEELRNFDFANPGQRAFVLRVGSVGGGEARGPTRHDLRERLPSR